MHYTKKIVLISLMLISGIVFGARERFMNSLSGSLNKPIRQGAFIDLKDQWLPFMIVHPIGSGSPYTNNFYVGEKTTKVILRYDDSKRRYTSKQWNLKVTYSIDLYDETGSVTNHTGEELTINYDPSEGITYTDVNQKNYTGYYGAKVTITCFQYASCNTTGTVSPCTLGSCDPSGTLPPELADVYLDIEQETVRYYNMDKENVPVVQFQNGFTVSDPLPNNTLPIVWSHTEGAESYDLEWLFLDAPNIDGSGAAINLALYNIAFDFRDASRINISGNTYNIPMAFSSGILLYRVRAKGYRVITTPSLGYEELDTEWSSFDPSSIGFSNSYSANPARRYNFAGLKTEMNWSYSVNFAEDGKRSESISFFDGVGKSRQSVGLINTDNTAVVSETKYDYEGRGVVSLMPVPLATAGITYYNNFAHDFDKTNFDTDSKLMSPDALGANDKTNIYYGEDNFATGLNSYIPDADGYAYSRVKYKNDGTGRVDMTSGVGFQMKMGGGHENRYYYGSPNSQTELDRMFGNEVGSVMHYQKTMQQDANGQISLSFSDQEGRTVATCISGNNPANLLPLDLRPSSPGSLTDDLLPGKDMVKSDGVLELTTDILVTQSQTYNFVYTLNETSVCENCLSTSESNPAPIEDETGCRDCLYDIDISITDAEGNPVNLVMTASTYTPCVASTATVTAISCTSLNTVTFNFGAALNIGQYRLTKTLKVHPQNVAALRKEYIDFQNLNHRCVEVPLIIPGSCENDCHTLCQQSYKVLQADGTTYKYIDDNGNEITESAALELIEECEDRCDIEETLDQGEGNDECSYRYLSLKADMSPGGQYFDNAYAQYDINSSGQLIINSSYSGTDINTWIGSVTTYTALNTMITAYATATFISGDPYYGYTAGFASFNALRAGWLPWFADAIVSLHPEYRFYQEFCTKELCTVGELTVTMQDMNDFKSHVYAINEAVACSTGYLNPTKLTTSTTYAAADLVNGNNIYVPCTYVTGGYSGYVDPLYLKCSDRDKFAVPCTTTCSGTLICTVKDFMNNKMKNFLEVATGKYVSIWYVMDDPLNIHLSTESMGVWSLPSPNTSTTVSADVVAFFHTLHGDGTAGTGLFAQPGGKYGFFLSQYNYYRDLLIYKNAKDNMSSFSPPFPLVDAGEGYTVADGVSFPKDQRHYIIRFPANQLAELTSDHLCDPNAGFADLTTITTDAEASVAEQCTTGCESYASEWIRTIKSCITTLSDTTTIKSLLVELCTKSCINDGEFPVGSDGCEGGPCTQSPSTYVTYGGTNYQTFDEIIALFGCTGVHLEHPAPTDNPLDCACRKFNQFDQAEATPGTPSPTPLSNADLAVALTGNLASAYTFTSTDIGNFRSFCNDPIQIFASGATLPANFPALMECDAGAVYSQANCNCENMNQFISAFGYNPQLVAVMDASDDEVIILTAQLNSALGLNQPGETPVTASQFAAWLATCHTSTPSTATLYSNAFPQLFRCPELGVEDNEFSVITQAQCLQSNLFTAIQHSANQYFDNVNEAADDYIAEIQTKCLNIQKPEKQVFTMNYVNYLFLYTLYYYDQAGNLIKTVPPEGFAPIGDPDSLADVKDFRTGVSSTAIFPYHRLATIYKYNTLNEVIRESSPDGGVVNKWYDNLGRLIVSQTDKQRVSSGGSSNNVPYNSFTNKSYSYSLYDGLGRVYEVGEFQNATDLTFDIAANRDPMVDLATWISAGTNKRQITKTYYDEIAFSVIPPTESAGWQKNLRNRISTVTYSESIALGVKTASYFNYDIHGNVKSLATENGLMPSGHKLKYTQYEYDLVSGNVNAVYYQKKQSDQFSHKYYYDADNRLAEAVSSSNGFIWKKEAKYYYFPHGPLARVETGDKQVSGTDYAYTLQGWIKGVNSNYLHNEYDMGKDGARNVTNGYYRNLNGNFANDAAGYTLGYYSGDYVAKNNTLANHFETTENYGSNTFRTFMNVTNSFTVDGTTFTNVDANQYNGNISRMVTALKKYDQTGLTTLARVFFYDQLNRLKHAADFDVAAPSSGSVTTTQNNNYEEGFTYDYNGNILTAQRYGISGGSRVMMDDLVYNYNKTAGPPSRLINNKLDFVEEQLPGTDDGDFGDDIDEGQTTGNYVYDNVGNLVKNKQDKIGMIEWNVYGKVQKVIRTTIDISMTDLEYVYDPMGRRMAKIEKPYGSTGPDVPNSWTYTLYSRDAQGNLLSVYKKTHPASTDELELNEQYIFGSSQLGSYRPNIELLAYSAPETQSHVVAKKQYQFSNHLGNVLQTISDKKLTVPGDAFYEEQNFVGTANSTAIQAYQGLTSDEIFTPAFPTLATTTFSGGFIGKEVEIGDDFSVSVYSKTASGTNLGQVVVSITDANGTQVSWHPQTLTNNSSGWTQSTYTFTLTAFNDVPMSYTPVAPYYANSFVWNTSNTHIFVDQLNFGITHNGTVQDLAGYKADVIQTTDYYSFGSAMEDRSPTPAGPDKGRFGMNGQESEKDDLGRNLYTAEYWEYDSRIGRRWNRDPVVKPWESPYACFNNNPVYFKDPRGLQGTSPDKNLYDRESGEKVGYQEDLNGKEYITDEYGHLTEDKKGFVSEYSITPENKAHLEEQEAMRNEQLKESRRISGIMDDFEMGFTTSVAVGISLPLVYFALPYIAAEGALIASEGGAAVNALYQTSSSLVAAKVSWNLGSGASDFITQSILLEGDYSKYNVSSTLGATFVGNPISGAAFGSAFEWNCEEGYQGIGNGKTPSAFIQETMIGSMGNAMGDGASGMFNYLNAAGRKTAVSTFEKEMLNLGGNLMGDLPSGVASDKNHRGGIIEN